MASSFSIFIQKKPSISERLFPLSNIVFNFDAAGFEVLKKYNYAKNYCFDDLGVEPTDYHYTKECNVMGEILLSRYDLFKTKNAKMHIPHQPQHRRTRSTIRQSSKE